MKPLFYKKSKTAKEKDSEQVGPLRLFTASPLFKGKNASETASAKHDGVGAGRTAKQARKKFRVFKDRR